MAARVRFAPWQSVRQLDDLTLIAGCARGESAPLGELFDRYQQVVYRFLSRLTITNPGDLDDLVQSTFLEVAKSAKGFREQSSVRSWILGIALNTARHHLRGEVRRRTMLKGAAQDPDLAGPAAAARPDQHAEQRQTWELLQSAIASLPTDLRVAFVACEMEELKGSAVAEKLGIPEGTLWRRLYEARKAIASSIRALEHARNQSVLGAHTMPRVKA